MVSFMNDGEIDETVKWRDTLTLQRDMSETEEKLKRAWVRREEADS